ARPLKITALLSGSESRASALSFGVQLLLSANPSSRRATLRGRSAPRHDDESPRARHRYSIPARFRVEDQFLSPSIEARAAQDKKCSLDRPVNIFQASAEALGGVDVPRLVLQPRLLPEPDGSEMRPAQPPMIPGFARHAEWHPIFRLRRRPRDGWSCLSSRPILTRA